MKTILETKDNKVKRIVVEMTVAEFSVFQAALNHFIEGGTVNEVDRKYAKRMKLNNVCEEREICISKI